MSTDDILLEAEMSMEKSVDYMVHEFAAVRTGKASPGLVENVDVHAYGSTMKLKQLALMVRLFACRFRSFQKSVERNWCAHLGRWPRKLGCVSVPTGALPSTKPRNSKAPAL